jgi:hypothetical protein
MTNEILNAEISNGDMPVAMGADNLVKMAEFAEKRIEAIKRIKRAALKVTSPHDWIDQSGKPYLNVSGAEKIARLFGISWRIDEPEIKNEDDGHTSFTYKGYFTMGPTTIEVIGSRSSKDPFFSRAHGKDIPPSEIDRNNVRKAAYTNLLGNGITRMLGLRGMTWEEVKSGGIDQSKTSKVEYGKKEMAKKAKEQRDKIGSMIMEMAGGNKKVAAGLLEEYTSFVAKDGKEVKGKSSLADLTEKQINPTYGRVKEEYEKWRGESNSKKDSGKKDEKTEDESEEFDEQGFEEYEKGLKGGE